METENSTCKKIMQHDVAPNNKGKVDNVTIDINAKVAMSNKSDVVSEVNKAITTEPDITTAKQNDIKLPVITLSDDAEEISPPTKSAKKRKSTNSISPSVYDDQILKRRKIKVAGAPKMPVTGYVRYMNERRETMRKEFPTKTAMEHTRMIAEEWGQLPEERKAPYIKAAAIERKKYLADLQVFLKAHPEVVASELAKNKPIRKSETLPVFKEKPQANGYNKSTGKENDKEKLNTQEKDLTPSPPIQGSLQNRDKAKCKRTPTPVNNNNTSNAPMLAPTVPGEIAIFTNEFLDHNKVHDMELRTLRKSKADLEQQNAVLEKHVENMKFGVEKMTNENNELEEKNRLLELYLNKLKSKLAQAFASLPLPTEPDGATPDNIQKYMGELYKMATSNTHGPACLNKAKDILRKLDLQVQL